MATAPPATPASLIRVNQAGYASGSPVGVVVMSQSTMTGHVLSVTDLSGSTLEKTRVPASVGRWGSSWRFISRVTLDPLPPGDYRVVVGDGPSSDFRVADAHSIFAPLADNAVTFFRAQRDGADQVAGTLGMAGHLHDRRASVYRAPRYRGLHLLAAPTRIGGPVDVSGGWSDAGDYLKFTYTASFADTLLLTTLRDYSAGVDAPATLRAEAAYGTRWLLRMWDRRRAVLHLQVGIGDGNGSILGDHDLWRTPDHDDRMASGSRARTRFLANRPVFDANKPGQGLAPNLAGRMAGAMGLCAQVFANDAPNLARRCLNAGRQIYARADTHWTGRLPTAFPPAYYEEPAWHGDMELGAIELSLAMQRARGGVSGHGAPWYLRQAERWARMAPIRLQESLSLRDVSSLAHADVATVLQARRPRARNAGAIIARMRQALQDPTWTRPDPFGLRDIASPEDQVPHALGVAIMMRLLDRVDGTHAGDAIARSQINWALGVNAWGQSFVVGAGTAFPRCVAHQIANLRGSLDATAPVLTGAVVNGPGPASQITGLGAPDGYRRCSDGGSLRRFDGEGQRYVDDVRSTTVSEPSDDYTALSLLAFAQAATG